MRRFTTIDPHHVRDACLQGRVLDVELWVDHRGVPHMKVTLGGPSEHKRHADAKALRVA